MDALTIIKLERQMDEYNESFFEEARHVLANLSKLPDDAWTIQDHDRYVWASNTLANQKVKAVK